MNRKSVTGKALVFRPEPYNFKALRVELDCFGVSRGFASFAQDTRATIITPFKKNAANARGTRARSADNLS